MTTLAVRNDPLALPAKVQYAHELANSGLLPAAFRRNPPNVLFAIEYGDMLGLAPMAAITGIHVIEGKPSASAGLISALVRRAGHKLRVTGNAKSATCQIVRCDDPDYTFEVTWTLNKNSDDNPSAEAAKLLRKDVWQNYPASMLKSRAITQCARDACEEALFGLHYTPEELGAEVDEEGHVLGGTVEGEPAPQEPAGVPVEAIALDTMLEQAVTFGTEDEGRTLWRTTAAQRKAGHIGTDDARQICGLIEGRSEELRSAASQAGTSEVPPAAEDDVVEGVVVDDLPPEDPWMAKVEEIISDEDASAALADLEVSRAKGSIAPDKAAAVSAAIEARRQELRAAA